MTVEQVDEMIRSVDRNGDGMIEYATLVPPRIALHISVCTRVAHVADTTASTPPPHTHSFEEFVQAMTAEKQTA